MPIAENDPAEVGFDADRLARIDRTSRRYVDDGRLAGWQVRGRPRRARPCTSSVHGSRDLEAGPAGRAGHALAHLLDDQADHLGRGDAAVGAGPFELNDELSRYLPEFADMRVLVGRQRRAAEDACRPPSRCASGTCSRTPPG